MLIEAREQQYNVVQEVSVRGLDEDTGFHCSWVVPVEEVRANGSPEARNALQHLQVGVRHERRQYAKQRLDAQEAQRACRVPVHLYRSV